MKKFSLILLIFIIVFTFTGCSFFSIFIGSVMDPQSSEKQEIVSRDSLVSMEFPASWYEYDLNDIAVLEMANGYKEQYLILITESKNNFDEEISLDEYIESVKSNMVMRIDPSESSDIKAVIIGSELSAKSFFISGMVNDINIKYYIVCYKDSGHYYQIITWSLPAKFDEAKKIYDEILSTFKILGNPDTQGEIV